MRQSAFSRRYVSVDKKAAKLAWSKAAGKGKAAAKGKKR